MNTLSTLHIPILLMLAAMQASSASLQIGSYSKINLNSRHVMEDFAYIGESSVGVFDGHGGPLVAQYLAQHMEEKIQAELNSELGSPDLSSMFKKIYQNFQESFHENFERYKRQGSTALVALVTSNKFTIANAGDSRAIWGSRNEQGQIFSTIDHSPSNQAELDRIHAEGGFIEYRQNIHRVGGIYALTRSLGDLPHVAGMSAEPTIYEVPLDNSIDFLVLATDGLWHYVEQDKVVEIVCNCHKIFSTNRANKAAQHLVNIATANRTRHDDIHVIVIFFNWR